MSGYLKTKTFARKRDCARSSKVQMLRRQFKVILESPNMKNDIPQIFHGPFNFSYFLRLTCYFCIPLTKYITLHFFGKCTSTLKTGQNSHSYINPAGNNGPFTFVLRCFLKNVKDKTLSFLSVKNVIFQIQKSVVKRTTPLKVAGHRICYFVVMSPL